MTMPSNFNFYLCNVNDKLSSIFVDLSLRRDAPDPYRNWLLWVWVEMNSPRFDGLSDGAEMQALSQIEADLLTALVPLNAVFAGSITGDNRREFYYYLPPSDNLKVAVRAAMKEHPDYRFRFGAEEDGDWRQYLGLLHPSEEVLQTIMNRDTLEVFKGKGDTLEIPREALHWVYFQEAADRDAFQGEAIAVGYSVSSAYERERANGRERYALCLTKIQPMHQDAIDESVIQLFRLSKQFNADYDGWESQVIAKPKGGSIQSVQ